MSLVKDIESLVSRFDESSQIVYIKLNGKVKGKDNERIKVNGNSGDSVVIIRRFFVFEVKAAAKREFMTHFNRQDLPPKFEDSGRSSEVF